MPAVELTRLRNQITQLLSRVHSPGEFHDELTSLFDRYSEHAYRPGKAVTSRPAIPMYRSPPLVVRQLEIELTAACKQMPEQMLLIADELWRDAYLEPRLMATHILGQLPAPQFGNVIERIRAWAHPELDNHTLESLLARGTIQLREYAANDLLDLIRDWLEAKEVAVKKIGLRCVEIIVEDPVFMNIPAIFRLLSPMLHAPAVTILNDLHHCIRAMIQRTPSETAFFLRQVLSATTNDVTARLARRVLPEFAPEYQTGLRSALRNRNPE